MATSLNSPMYVPVAYPAALFTSKRYTPDLVPSALFTRAHHCAWPVPTLARILMVLELTHRTAVPERVVLPQVEPTVTVAPGRKPVPRNVMVCRPSSTTTRVGRWLLREGAAACTAARAPE